MKSVSHILHNAIVVCMDPEFSIFDPGAIAIDNDLIVSVGPENGILREYTTDCLRDCQQDVVMPGLVNTHCHAAMTLLRGLADDLRLDVWLMGYMMPVEREFVDPDFVRLGTKIACGEMIRSGITTFADMYYFQNEISETTAQAGMRAVMGQSVLKFPSPDSRSYEESLSLCESLIKKWKNHPLIVPGLAPHAIYTCTPEILTEVTEMALKYDVPVQFHVAETQQEVENNRDQVGMPVVPYIKKLGMLETKLIAAHCVHLDEGEIRSLQHANAGIAHNPSSNLKLASGFAPTKRMVELNAHVGIGTDGPASNNDLDMFEEIRLASLIAKAHTGDPTALPARKVVEMATILGAKAIHLDELIGSLEPGKRADLIRISLHPLHNLPRFRRDPDGVYAQVIYASKSTDVCDVMVNGQWLMKDKELLTINEGELENESNQFAKRIDTFLIHREESILSKLIAIGGAAEEESFEVQAKVQVDDLEPILEAIINSKLEIIRERHYHEYDTYFHFSDPAQGKLRYREDEFIDKAGKVTNVRSRLTLIGETFESNDFADKDILLSRSRYLAPATHSLRFYNEYFKPIRSYEIQKDRKRYLVRFEETEFFINLDTLTKPDIGKFVEIKSRTWSKQDALTKTELMGDLLLVLGLSGFPLIHADYTKLVESSSQEQGA